MPRTPTPEYEDWMDAAYLDEETAAYMDANPDALIEQAAEYVADLYGIDYDISLDADDEATIVWHV